VTVTDTLITCLHIMMSRCTSYYSVMPLPYVFCCGILCYIFGY